MKSSITRAVYHGLRKSADFTQATFRKALSKTAHLHVSALFDEADKVGQKSDDLFDQAEVLRHAALATANEARDLDAKAEDMIRAAEKEALDMGVNIGLIG